MRGAMNEVEVLAPIEGFAQTPAAVNVRRPTARVRGVKPMMRGIPDVLAVIVAVPAAGLLIASAQPGAVTGAIIYGLSLVFLFAASALYHTPYWPVDLRQKFRAIDHSTIYVYIAGTYTPVCLNVLPPHLGVPLCWAVWAVAVFGLLKSFLWKTSPRWLNTSVYIGFGLMSAPFTLVMLEVMGAGGLALLALGGLAYIVGAMIYLKRWPNPNPMVFGYHEIFHVFVISASALHYWMIWRAIV